MHATDLTLNEMAFPKAVAEAKIRSKEETINLHVVKLLAFDCAEPTREFWRKEIEGETEFLSNMSIRLGKGVRRVTAAVFFSMLYSEPFEQNEIPYTNGLIRTAMIKADQAGTPLRRNARGSGAIAADVRAFHEVLSGALHDGSSGGRLIASLGTP